MPWLTSRLPVMLITAVLVAGCSQPPDDSTGPRQTESLTTTPSIPPEPEVEVTREIFNESKQFPTTPQGQGWSDSFVVGDALNLTIAISWIIRCPGGPSGGAEVVLRDPAGSETVFEGTGNFDSVCLMIGSEMEMVSGHLTLEEPAAGEWSLESGGYFPGWVEVVVTETVLVPA